MQKQLSCRGSWTGKHNVMALWHYVCFGGYQEHDTNEHGRGETVQSFYCYQGPLSPGNLMSKFTRCSHPFLLIYINSFTSQRNRRHPQPIIPAPRMFFQHPTTSFTLPYLSAAQSWFIALFTFTAVPLLPSSRTNRNTARSRTFPFALLYLATGCSKLWWI